MNRSETTDWTEAVTLYRPMTLFYMGAMAMMMVPLLTLVDMGVAQWFASDPLPRDLNTGLELCLVFSHGTGIFLVLWAILLMAPRQRWHVPRLATLAMGGGAVATIAKMLVIRPRPSENIAFAGQDGAWMWEFDWSLSQIAAYDINMRAFPSGNVVTATALIVGLWIVLPRGRFLYATVWVGVVLQRLSDGSHFLSDACGGAALGLLWAFTCYHPKLLGTLFEKMAPERRVRKRFAEPVRETGKPSEPARAPESDESMFPHPNFAPASSSRYQDSERAA